MLVSYFEREDWDGFVEIETKPDLPDSNPKVPNINPPKPDTPLPDNEIPQANPIPDPEPPLASEESTSEVETQLKHVWKPTCKLCDILEGCALATAHSGDPPITHSVQFPTPNANKQVFEGVGTADWMMPAESEEEYALVAEISKMEVLEPCNLAEAKSWPDWQL